MAEATGTTYATRADLFSNGIPQAALVPLSRTVKSVSTATSRFVVPGHGLDENSPLRVESSGSVPAPLDPSTVYYAAPVLDSEDLLQLRTAPGGAVVTLTDAGTGVVRLAPQLGSQIDRTLEMMSRKVDEHLRAHTTPLVTWPSLVTLVVVALAAQHLVGVRGLLNPQYADQLGRIQQSADWAMRMLEAWRKGQAVAGLALVEDQTPDTHESSAVGWYDVDAGEARIL